MKKLLTPVIALATMMLGITSCQNDELVDNPAGGNEVEVTFTAQLENAAATRAIGDGTTANKLFFSVFKADATTEIEALRKEVDVTGLKATINTRLVKGQTYNFVFWAQSANGGKYYDISDRDAIKVIYENNATDGNCEDRDAFYAVRKDLKIAGPINETITLKRPFAQVNVGTKIGTLAEAATAGSDITKTSLRIENVATQLNVFDGSVNHDNSVGVNYSLAKLPETNLKDDKGDLKNVDEVDYEYLSMNYLLVADNATDGAGKQLVNATLTVNTENGEVINTFSIPNVPVQRNWRTNIIGDILSSNVTFNIVIDPTFDDEHNYYINEELYYAAENGGEVTLQEPLTIDGSKEAPALVIKAGRSVILNLNGQSIKSTVTTGNTDGIYVEEGATLTINGEGTIETADGGDGYPIFARGKVVINGGTYISHKDADGATNACIYAKGNGEVEVNGGTFSTETGAYVLNLYDSDRATASITAKGGTFVNFDPANNASEGAGTNFVAEGYKSVNKGDNYIVVANDVEVVATADELTEALNENKKITLANDIELSTTAKGSVNIDGNNHKMEIAKNNSQYMIQPTGGVIKNLTISGYNERNTNEKVLRGIYTTPDTDLLIENCHISGVAYPINTGSAKTTGKTLTVKNSTLVGWTSFSGGLASANFSNTHFGIGNYFGTESDPSWNGNLKPYVKTTLTECTFDEGFYIDFSELAAGEILTLKNCKVGDTVITTTNIWSLLKKGSEPAEGVLVIE